MFGSFLTYLLLGFFAILVPSFLISDTDLIANSPPLGFSQDNMFFLLTLWTAGAFWWIFELANQEKKLGRLPRRTRIGLALGLLALGLLAALVHPITSLDTTYYIAYGRQVLIGVSPYHSDLWSSEADLIISQLNKFWFGMVCVYGPVALFFSILTQLIVSSPALFALVAGLKCIWLVFFVVLANLAARIWKHQPLRTTLTLAAISGPIMIWTLLVDGHLELLMLVFLLAMALAADRGFPFYAALGLTLAVGTKVSGLVCAPIVFFWFARSSFKSALKFAAGLSLGCGAILAVTRGNDLRAAMNFLAGREHPPTTSIVPRLLWRIGVDFQLTRTISDVIFYSAIALISFGVLRGVFKTGPYLPIGLSYVALFFTRNFFNYWYVWWFWPLLWFSFRDGRRALRSIAICNIAILLSFGLGWPWNIYLLTLGAVYDSYSAFVESWRARDKVGENRNESASTNHKSSDAKLTPLPHK